MQTTTIRVDKTTHADLVELSRGSGASIMETVRDAAEALRRQRFAHDVTAEIAELRTDADAWDSYVAEAEATSVVDGIG